MGILLCVVEEIGMGLMEFGSALVSLQMHLQMISCVRLISFFQK